MDQFFSPPGSHLESNCTCLRGSVAWGVLCPAGFIHYPGSRHCYEVKGITAGSPAAFPTTERVTSAIEYCDGRNAHLMSNVQSFAELEWLQQLGAQSYWIGARWDLFDETLYWTGENPGVVDYFGLFGAHATLITSVPSGYNLYIPSANTGFRSVLWYSNWLKTVCQTDKPDDICVDACATDQFWCDSDGVPQACTVTCPSGSGIAPTCSYASDGVCEVCASNKKYVSAGLYDGTPTATYVTPSITYPLCVPCPVDHYCVGGVEIPCPPGSLCPDGVKIDCPANSWCVRNRAIPCDTNLVSNNGSSSKSNCSCMEGYMQNISACGSGLVEYEDTGRCYGLGNVLGSHPNNAKVACSAYDGADAPSYMGSVEEADWVATLNPSCYPEVSGRHCYYWVAARSYYFEDGKYVISGKYNTAAAQWIADSSVPQYQLVEWAGAIDYSYSGFYFNEFGEMTTDYSFSGVGHIGLVGDTVHYAYYAPTVQSYVFGSLTGDPWKCSPWSCGVRCMATKTPDTCVAIPSPCEAGTYGSVVGTCKPCEPAHYCPGGGQMFECPQNSTEPVRPECVRGKYFDFSD